MEGLDQGYNSLPLAKCPDPKVEKLFTSVLMRTSKKIGRIKNTTTIAHLWQVEEVQS